MTRTQSSIKNLYTAVIGQAAGIIISFIARKVFLMCLSREYLGINGLFTNILTVLSLAELGVGSAMTFALYKPIASGDKELIKSLMRLYRRAYTVIGCAVLIFAAALTPFYTFFMDKVPDIPNLTAIYLLYAANTGISYFFTYKRTLIICDRKRYIATIYRYAFYFLLNIAQIAALVLTRNYVLFMVLQVIFTLAENICLSLYADKIYPYLRDKDVKPLPKSVSTEIVQNIKAMVMHKIGGIAVNSTDNILLSKITGLVSAGIYSNYYLITNALTTVIMQVFSSVSAEVGNLNAEKEDKTSLISSFYKMFFLNFWIYGFSLCCLVSLFNPFITLWLGDGMTFDMLTVITISASFFIMGMRRTVLTYRESAGVFRPDRWKPAAEAVINLGVSVILARVMGPAGVFLGTIISTLSLCIWIEPLVVYRHVFKTSPLLYFKRLGIYSLSAAAVCTATFLLCSLVGIDTPFWNFIARAAISLICPNICFAALFGRTDEFSYFRSLIAEIFSAAAEKLGKRRSS